MGKQKSKTLQRHAEELHRLYPEKFSTDFEQNKRQLDGLKIFPSKMSRNIVAGILVKLTRGKEL